MVSLRVLAVNERALVFTADDAVSAAEDGRDVILVRPFTEADDVGGFHAAKGILTAVGFAAALTLVSFRSGVFTIAAVAAAAIGAELLAGLFGAPPLGIGAAALLFAILGVHFALLALAWRDARSPRFNPRETTEAAATEGVGRFAVCVVASVGTLYAADVTGFWPEADAVALRLIIGSIIGVLLAPALMTALSAAAGRESA